MKEITWARAQRAGLGVRKSWILVLGLIHVGCVTGQVTYPYRVAAKSLRP